MYRNKRKRKLIIFSLIGILLCMVAGYAAFQTKLEVKGTSKVTSNWNIIITNVTDGSPTGTAENNVSPSWTDLTAYMEANLYEKGDAMEYDVTIENKGTIDAKLNDILTNLENNNEAVIITFSGYTKGEVLKSGESKIVHVKIEYNPSYEGEETSSEVKIDFEYTQNNNETENPDNKFLVTYDCTSNGGTDCSSNNEYKPNNSLVDLSYQANKEGYTFIGWNTDKDATEGLTEYKMPGNNSTLYAIYGKALKVTYEKGENISSIGKTEDTCSIYNNEISCEITLPTITAINEYVSDGWYNGETKVGNSNDKYNIENDITLTSKAIADNVGLTISTTATTNSITVVANASATSGISKYEFSKDGGSSWTDGGTNKTYTFTKLTQGTNYNIQARVTSKSTKKVTATKTVTTSTIVKPTYKEAATSTGKTVTITYPAGCGSTYTCTYQKDKETAVTVKATTAAVAFKYDGSVTAKVTDGTNSVSNSYAVKVLTNSNINYSTHVSSIGWQDYVSGGTAAGATGKNIEAIKIKLINLKGLTGGISYNAHVADKGWLGYVNDDALGGTTGESLAMQAIQIKLTGEVANYYDVYYRANVASMGGWMDWAKNGGSAGTKGYSYPMQQIEIRLVAKGEAAPGPTTTPFKEKPATQSISITSSLSTGNFQSCLNSWNSKKFTFKISVSGGSLSSGKMCYATSSSSATSYCNNYPTNGSAGYGSACFDSATTWNFYRSSDCAYAYAMGSHGKSTSKIQC